MQRIARALQDVGWVTPAVPNGGVFPGPRLIELAVAVGGRPAHLVILHPHLEQLSRELNETVGLSTRRHDRALFAGQVTAGQRLRAVSAARRDLRLHCSANGKAMLATLPDPFIETIIGRRFPTLHG